MKYKVGDKVRVKTDLELVHEHFGVIPYFNEDGSWDILSKDMLRYRGKVLTIASLRGFGYKVIENDWNWTDGMLDPYLDENEVV